MSVPAAPGVAAPQRAERDRLLRRMEHNARARERAQRMNGVLTAKRTAVKEAFLQEHSDFRRTYLDTMAERTQRWTAKTQESPFHLDLWDEDERKYHANMQMNVVAQRKQKLAEIRQREAYDTIQRKATSERDELSELRTERRILVENMKNLKAIHDVNKSNTRAAKVIEERNKKELDRQQAQLERAMSSPGL
eukprot:CAMPEP_0197648128 /NCGR_PEP_ID=MMETSP1338-20131121/27570_1 /TAXON_ID=43686 ORGANISM="Pelagodinium beii, Strain RCC1491" /NCGR_SAMPLE_ID=MMETSP1338 /ASSEMBLY_ACC=CAM_ASM_000754 /LENGTH=192 /DNA_ID=CAMNT_0043222071 /DNA_START=55 /DNA_END=633 /DNA_ORIENTATION=+